MQIKKIGLMILLLAGLALGAGPACEAVLYVDCISDDDCPDGEICDASGVCVGGEFCDSDDDCDPGEVCDADGFCVIP